MTRVADGLLTTGELLDRAGTQVSFRAFSHWVSKGAITPRAPGVGSGSWHAWAPEDVQRLKRVGRWQQASEAPLSLSMVSQLWHADPDLPLRIDAVGVLIYLPVEQ